MNANKFIEHLDYLLSLCRQTRAKRKEWLYLIEKLKERGNWKRAYNLKPYKRKQVIKNLEGKVKPKSHYRQTLENLRDSTDYYNEVQ